MLDSVDYPTCPMSDHEQRSILRDLHESVRHASQHGDEEKMRNLRDLDTINLYA